MKPPLHGRRIFDRRALLRGVGVTGAAALLRPTLAEAEGKAPLRFVVVHRPCGTRPAYWMPTRTGDDYELTQILQVFQPVRQDMLLMRGLTGIRDLKWQGDQHALGLIGHMTGKRAIPIPGTTLGSDANAKNVVGADVSIDQALLAQSATLRAAPLQSVQLAADPASSTGLPNFRVLSYAGLNRPMFPEARPAKAYANIFGVAMPGGTAGASAADLMKLRARRQSLLDFVKGDLARLSAQVPASQRPKMDSHLAALRQLEMTLDAAAQPRSCNAPAIDLPTYPGRNYEMAYLAGSRTMAAIIKTALQCDLTRVVSFSFSHGNSDLRLGSVLGFANPDIIHGISHGNSPGADSDGVKIEQFHGTVMTELVTSLRQTPEAGGTMLDNTVIVYLSECNKGDTHSTDNQPVLVFGRAGGQIKQGRQVDAGGRYTNDLWITLAQKLGVDLPTFGDPVYVKGPLPGI